MKLSESDWKMVIKATKIATFSDLRVRVGAVVSFQGKVLSAACNVQKNLTDIYPNSMHAEIGAIRLAPYEKLPRATLTVVRINRDHVHVASHPCDICSSYFESFYQRPKYLIYMLENGVWVKEKM